MTVKQELAIIRSMMLGSGYEGFEDYWLQHTTGKIKILKCVIGHYSKLKHKELWLEVGNKLDDFLPIRASVLYSELCNWKLDQEYKGYSKAEIQVSVDRFFKTVVQGD